jgi:hypothetical protein
MGALTIEQTIRLRELALETLRKPESSSPHPRSPSERAASQRDRAFADNGQSHSGGLGGAGKYRDGES